METGSDGTRVESSSAPAPTVLSGSLYTLITENVSFTPFVISRPIRCTPISVEGIRRKPNGPPPPLNKGFVSAKSPPMKSEGICHVEGVYMSWLTV